MKILILLAAIVFLLPSGIMAQEGGTESCVQSYEGGLALGYNALAMAIDDRFFVCGYAFGHTEKKYAERSALASCEQGRKDPAGETGGVRKIMTHCRIVRFNFIE